jgi:hypothetical protein
MYFMENKSKIDRRNFLKMSAVGAVAAGSAAILLNSGKLFNLAKSGTGNSGIIPLDTKKVFWKYGTCSRTFLYTLNREFGYLKETEECASDPLAGGLMMGHQCGMLWGSALAVGAESFRRYNDHSLATAKAITATQRVMDSFSRRTKCVNCRNIVGFDFSNKLRRMNFLANTLPGGFKNFVCMNLAEKWAPEAIQSAREGLSKEQTDMPEIPLSCASELAKKMKASDEETIMVAGLAGGMGLSGNACGALGAAIWMNTLNWCRKNPGKSGYSNPNTKEIVSAFKAETGSEFLCSKISGQRFKTIGDHTEFVKNGGCEKLINLLAAHKEA